jgi:hypothetical protein
MTRDPVRDAFLVRQHEEGMALAASSDVLDLEPMGGAGPDRYVATFRCGGLVTTADGSIVPGDRFVVGIWFPPDYLRHAEPFQVLTWLGPRRVFHPNISDIAPVICIGRVTPGTPLVELLYQCHAVITWRKVTMREDDALNRTACAWARDNQHRFPIDPRPLKRRQLRLTVNTIAPESP